MRSPGIVTASIIAAFAAWSASPTLAQSAKDQLVVGAEQFLTNMHPLIQVNNTKRAVIGYSQRPITAFDEKGINVCVLCETLPTVGRELMGCRKPCRGPVQAPLSLAGYSGRGRG